MRLLVTAGPTIEDIDEVRYISNRSSGRMGYALAACAIKRGWQVTLVSGPVAVKPPEGLASFESIRSSRQMADAVFRAFPEMDAVLMAAAVADYKPAKPVAGKIKRSGRLVLELVPTVDILASLGKRKKDSQVLIGFALEAGSPDDTAVKDEAIRKAHRKRLDAVVLNSPANIGAEAGRILVLSPAGAVLADASGSKVQLAAAIIGVLEGLLAEKRVWKK